MARVRLTVGELSRTDRRPIREVLADAVHLADSAMGELRSAVEHGDASADTVARLLDSARYAAALGKIAIDAGVVNDPAPALTIATAQADLARAALLHALDGILAEVPPGRRPVLHGWALDAIRAYLAAVAAGEPAPEPPPVPSTDLPGATRAEPGAATAGDVVDAEVEPDDDPDTDEPGDAELIAAAAESAQLGALLNPPRRPSGVRV